MYLQAYCTNGITFKVIEVTNQTFGECAPPPVELGFSDPNDDDDFPWWIIWILICIGMLALLLWCCWLCCPRCCPACCGAGGAFGRCCDGCCWECCAQPGKYSSFVDDDPGVESGKRERYDFGVREKVLRRGITICELSTISKISSKISLKTIKIMVDVNCERSLRLSTAYMECDISLNSNSFCRKWKISHFLDFVTMGLLLGTQILLLFVIFVCFRRKLTF